MDGVVEVSGGRIRGVEEGGLWRFAGIPYAGSTAGSRRWRPPVPPESWTGIKDANRFGPSAPQTPPRGGLTFPDEPTEQSEDCLSLNIWTPALDEGRRPVMVWIHGGSFLSGSGSSFLFRGAEMADVGDVVVVTLNYRVGALGFLAHPALSTQAGSEAGPMAGRTYIGNWGLHDQVCALQWVRRHIGAFGGDADNVTVFGESAGAMSICALLAAPTARTLFGRAIIQSGPPYTHTLARAAGAAESLAAVLGVRHLDRSLLEAVPAGELVAAAQELADRKPNPGELPLPFLPAIDGTFLARPPEEAISRGEARHVSMIVGSTRDEMTLFTMNNREWAGLGEPELKRRLAAVVGDVGPERLVNAYRTAREARGDEVDPTSLWNAIGSDLVFRWPTLRLADAQRRHQPATYVYLFTWTTPFGGGKLGACHGIDLPFVFGAVRFPAVAAFAGGGAEAEDLAWGVEHAWTTFARRGDPSCDPLGEWPAWDPERRPTMVLGREAKAVDAPRDEELSIWREHADAWTGLAQAPGEGHLSD